MQTVRFGRTGLTVGVAGLGCGGESRLGQGTGASERESVALVQHALDLGINYFDTAAGYGTEGILGKAIAGRRDEVVLSTKAAPQSPRGTVIRPTQLRKSVESSLRALQTETIDVFHLHGVHPDEYDACTERLLPELEQLRDAGKIRFLALSEKFMVDTGHAMLQRALVDDSWDVVMVGFNPLNQSARARVFAATIAKDVAVEVMFAVRRAFSRPEERQGLVDDLVRDGLIDPTDADDLFAFLVHEDGATSITDAAYRFARHEPGCHVVLTGTGDRNHLGENVRSINRPPLPAADLDRLRRLFGHLDSLHG